MFAALILFSTHAAYDSPVIAELCRILRICK